MTGVELSAIIPVIVNGFAEYNLTEKNQHMRILLIRQYFMRDINVLSGHTAERNGESLDTTETPIDCFCQYV